MLGNYSFDERCFIDTYVETQQNVIQFQIDDATGTPKAMIHNQKVQKAWPKLFFYLPHTDLISLRIHL